MSGLIFLTITIDVYIEYEVFLFPVVIIAIGLANTKWIGGLNEMLGDLSYGVYIYGFVIQQALSLATIPIALLAGFLSWILIEKHAMKLNVKKRMANQICIKA
jgi:peptidoglycan/LPS O-acetylase OafA/YrhL